MVLDEQGESAYRMGTGGSKDLAWTAGKVFAREYRSGTVNLCISADGNPAEVIRDLLTWMEEPLWLLYVLVVTRGEGAEGRYQSPEPISRDAAQTFLNRFHNYLGADGRCNLWLKSAEGPCLIVSDRHDLIYAYGPIDVWVKALEAVGWTSVERDALRLPDPHSHRYHAVFDEDARAILRCMEWTFSPLLEQDL